MRIIGCGNDSRGDDGAGLLVARRLRELGIAALDHPGEAAGLIEAWSGSDDVVLVDAVLTGAPPGTVHLWEGSPARLSPPACVSSHGMGVAEAVGLAQALGRLPRRLRVYGIEASRLAPGSEPSPEVLAAVEAVARRIAGPGGR